MVSSNIILSSVATGSLLSIAKTQSLVDDTTLRLSSGLKVNSALDNPQNFFAASSLNQRAQALQNLSSNISANILVVQQANTGVEAISDLVEQTSSIVEEAREVIENAERVPIARGNQDINDVADLTSLNGISDGDRIRLTTRSPDVIDYAPPLVDVTISAGTNANELAFAINNAIGGGSNPFIEASINDDGALELRAKDEFAIYIEFQSVADTDESNQALASALGFSDVARLAEDGNGGNDVQFTLNPSPTLTSFQLFDAATNSLASSTDLISALEGAGDTPIFFRLDNPNDRYEIGINGGERVSILLDNTQTVQGFVNAINTNTNLNEYVEANFDDVEGRITITAIDNSVSSIETAFSSGALGAAYFGFNISAPIYFTDDDVDSIQVGSIDENSLDTIRGLEEDYASVIASIDEIALDAAVQGVNLLAGDSLQTFFNEDLTSRLITEGRNLNSGSIGLDESSSLRNASDIDSKADESDDALQEVRSFGYTLATNLSIIETREQFIDNTINILQAGADDLTQANLNEEGANLLALQTQQELATIALGLGEQDRGNILTILT